MQFIQMEMIVSTNSSKKMNRVSKHINYWTFHPWDDFLLDLFSFFQLSTSECNYTLFPIHFETVYLFLLQNKSKHPLRSYRPTKVLHKNWISCMALLLLFCFFLIDDDAVRQCDGSTICLFPPNKCLNHVYNSFTAYVYLCESMMRSRMHIRPVLVVCVVEFWLWLRARTHSHVNNMPHHKREKRDDTTT